MSRSDHAGCRAAWTLCIVVLTTMAVTGRTAWGEGALVPCKKCPDSKRCTGGCRDETCPGMVWFPVCQKPPTRHLWWS